MPPGPGAPDGFPTAATWSWYEALGVYLLAFVLAGIAGLLHISFGSARDALFILLNLPLALIGGVVGIYLSAYFIRLRAMSSQAKATDTASSARFFVQEQMVAAPALVVLLIAGAAIESPISATAIRIAVLLMMRILH